MSTAAATLWLSFWLSVATGVGPTSQAAFAEAAEASEDVNTAPTADRTSAGRARRGRTHAGLCRSRSHRQGWSQAKPAAEAAAGVAARGLETAAPVDSATEAKALLNDWRSAAEADADEALVRAAPDKVLYVSVTATMRS